MSATTVDELQVIISANAAQFTQEIKKVQAQMSNLGKTASVQTSGMKSLSVAGVAMGTVLGNVFSKVAGIVSSQFAPAISRLDTLNNFPRVMANLGISGEQSQKSIAILSEKLKGLPTTLDDAAMSVQRFTSANGNLGASTQMFLALNNAILAGGASTDIQKTALEQLSQAYAKGKPDMMEWRSLMTAMPAQLKQLAESMKYANANELGEALREGKLSMNDFMSQIVKLNREGYGNFASFEEQARNSTGGVATSLANLRNAVVRAVTDILNIVGQANISNFFSSVAKAISAVVPYIAGFVKVVMMAIGALRTLFGGGKSAPAKATAEISDNLGGASSNANNLASGAGNAGKKLGGAAKQAKKLAESLAGFDEMNVLKTPDESSGGGGSGKGDGGSGGAMSGTLPDFGEIDTSGLDSVAKKAEEIAEQIKRFFEDMFDFKKIGNSLKRFWNDLKAGAKPVFEVITSVWGSYLKPFISWAGNDLLPAFLNALGGAARLAGAGFKAAYDISKPFIDAFLVPLAKLAGGAIVGFLNGIGDAFRELSKNKGLVEFLVGTTMAITGLTAAIRAAEAIKNFNDGISTMRALMISSPQAMQSMVASLGGVKSAFVLAGGGLSGLKAATVAFGTTLKTSIISSFNTIMAHPLVLAVAGIAAGIAFIGGSIKSAFEQSNPALWESEARTKAFQKAQENLKTATENVKNAEDALNNARASQADAQIAYTEAIKRQEEAQQNLANVLASSNITEAEKAEIIRQGAENYASLDEKSRAVYDAHLQLESANARVKTSQDALNTATEEATTKNEEHKKALDEKRAALMADATSQAVIEGKYKNSTEALKALKDGTLEYKDENGNMVKASTEDIANLEGQVKEKSQEIVKSYRDSKSGADQGFFGPMGKSLAQAGQWLGDLAGTAGQELGKFKDHLINKGREAWNGLTSFFSGIGRWFSERWNDVTRAFSNAWQAFSDIGRNMWEGLKSGLGNLAKKIGDMFKSAVDGVKSFLGIHSPSRLFRSFGGFVGEGFALGIDDEQNSIAKTLQNMTAGFKPEIPPFEFAEMPKLSNNLLPDISEIEARFEQRLEASINDNLGEKLDRLNEKPINIIVNVGNEKMLEQLIDGINDRSFLTDSSVINL